MDLSCVFLKFRHIRTKTLRSFYIGCEDSNLVVWSLTFYGFSLSLLFWVWNTLFQSYLSKLEWYIICFVIAIYHSIYLCNYTHLGECLSKCEKDLRFKGSLDQSLLIVLGKNIKLRECIWDISVLLTTKSEFSFIGLMLPKLMWLCTELG